MMDIVLWSGKIQMYEGGRVLVAGGTGTIGIPLVKELIKLGSQVTIASLDTEKRFTEIFGHLTDQIVYKRLDLTEISDCEKAVDSMDYVFNLVGIKGSVGIGETKVASYLLPMLRFQSNLIQASYSAKVKKYLFTGSVCSYPQSEMHHEENMWNGMPKQNDRIPGIAKRVGELLGEAFELEYGWDAVRVVRPSNVYGPYDDFNPATAQVIPSIIHKVLNSKGPVKVWGDGSAIRDFIYSEDVAYWMTKALERAPSNFPINLGNGVGLSIKEIADTIVKIANPSCELQWEPTGPVGDPIRVMSMERAKAVIGFESRTNLVDGITRTIDWYRNRLI
jgi:GDP-L-fucose synthase